MHSQTYNPDYMVPALKKGQQILDLFSPQQRVLTIGEFAERLEVSTSAIYHHGGDPDGDGLSEKGRSQFL